MADSFNDVLALLSGHAIVRSIAVAAELRIPDALVGGPKSAAELASECKLHEQSLLRLMRALAAVGIFTETEAPVRFGLTPLSNWLRSDAPNSLRDFARLRGGELCWQAWGQMQKAVETGACAFELQHGQEFFAYTHAHPEAGAEFNDAMRSLSSQVHADVIRAYDFTQFQTITDVGGGSGAFVAALLRANPQLQAILFDRPAAIAKSPDLLAASRVADRCRTVSGDFFDAVPLGSEAILLSRILHDFSDEDCLRILRNCRAALPRGGRLLVVEYVVGAGAAGTAAKLFDLHMFVYFGAARERTPDEFCSLLSSCGFTLQRIVESSSLIAVLEATAT